MIIIILFGHKKSLVASTRLNLKESGRLGSNLRPTAWKAVALPAELRPLIYCGEGRIRTFEAEATELQSVPFDRSGTSPEL